MADWKGTISASTESSDQISQNLAVMTDRLHKREDERQALIQKKKAESENETFSVQGSTQLFLDSFANEFKKIEDGVTYSVSVQRSGLIEHFDGLSLQVLKLHRYVSESAMFLPGYELKTAQNSLVLLQNKIQEKRDEMLPKKKFAFKSNKKTDIKAIKTSSVNVSEPNIGKDSKAEEDTVIELAACKFVGASNETLQKHSHEISQKDVALACLNDCKVFLFGAPSAIHINKLENCVILSGPVSGSIFIRECVNCTFVLACQQLRIHSTKNSQFYIHVTSKAIIEDCDSVTFAPYNWTYEKLENDYTISGLAKDRNNWNQIDDFNWLVSDEQSPNWSLLEESERVTSWKE